MASWNFTKRADRERAIARNRDEMKAMDAGTWPRNLDEEFRYGVNRTFHDRAQKIAYVRELLKADNEYLRGVSARVKAGELPGWEA